MALIVEDGTGKSDADAYIDIAYLDSYLASVGKTISGDTTAKEIAIRKATEYMTQNYYGAWKGYKRLLTQSLDFPRELVLLDDAYYEQYLANDIVPVQVKKACAELAYKAASGTELMPDLTQGVKREKVDVLEVEYDTTTPQWTRYQAIDGILKPLLANTNSSVVRLSRV